jgi:hypothetical protein
MAGSPAVSNQARTIGQRCLGVNAGLSNVDTTFSMIYSTEWIGD